MDYPKFMFYYDASFVILFLKHLDLKSLKKQRGSVSFDLAIKLDESLDRQNSIFIECKDNNIKIHEEYLDVK